MPRPRSLLTQLPSLAEPMGLVTVVLAVAMLGCAAQGALMGDTVGAWHLFVSASVGLLAGGALVAYGRTRRGRVGPREALLVVSFSWALLAVYGGLPFVLGAAFTWPDAIFESVSGFTTTGATILPEITQRLSTTLHLWRAFTHWLGGLGIVVLFVALFPVLGVGGKHLFKTEAPGPPSAGLRPRIAKTAQVLWQTYLGLTVIQVFSLRLAGLSWFEAELHAFSTMGTGGFSSHNMSIAGYESVAIEGVIVVFMLLAGANFALFPAALQHGWRAFARDVEFRWYIGIWALASLVIAIDLQGHVDHMGEGLRHSTFQVASIMTTTGFASADFENWPTLSVVVLTLLYFIGGSAGSTAGGIKVVRIAIMVQVAITSVKRWARPRSVEPVRLGGRALPEDLPRAVLAYASLYVLGVLAFALVVAALEDTSLTTAFSASLACVANVGPGWDDVGAVDNFGWMTDGSKLALSLAMLLGRLEFFPLLALVFPEFWRRE